jgi:hypothetical protein
MAIRLGQRRTVSLEERNGLADCLEIIQIQLRNSGLPTSEQAAAEAGAAIRPATPDFGWQLTPSDIVSAIDDIKKSIRREMNAVAFLYIPSDDAKIYRFPLENWEKVVGRWPDLKGDITESARCLALDRYAAAMFHILLVAEFGTIQVCKLLGVAGDRPGWGCVEKLQAIKDKEYKSRSPLEQEHSTLLKNTLDGIMFLKNARHIIMHTDNKGDWLAREVGPQSADEVIRAARNLMRRLADELPAVP